MGLRASTATVGALVDASGATDDWSQPLLGASTKPGVPNFLSPSRIPAYGVCPGCLPRYLSDSRMPPLGMFGPGSWGGGHPAFASRELKPGAFGKVGASQGKEPTWAPGMNDQ